jgi:tetratricopeptide (TPR) repeat protein
LQNRLDEQQRLRAVREKDQAITTLMANAQLLQRQGNLAAAQARFEQVLKASPNNVDALVGLGFVRLNQKAFDAAANAFARAQTLDPKRPEIEEGARTARFWGVIQQAAEAFERNRPDEAIAHYKDAATIDPNNPRGWLGLMRIAIEAGDPRGALDTVQSIPQSTRSQLDAHPEYLARLARALYATNQPSDGDRILHAALDAASRSDSDEAFDARLELASFLVTQGNDGGAVSIYTHAAGTHPDNTAAWEGLIGVLVRMRDYPKALTALRSMPRGSYEAAAKHPGFLNTAATVYSAQGFCVEAERLLTRSLDLDKAAGRRPTPGTQLQLASVWMREGRHDRAAVSYRSVLDTDPQSVDAWRGYITALHNARQDFSAMADAQRMPAAVRTTLMSESEFLRLVGSVHAEVGNNAQAVELLEQARARYRAAGQPSPPDLDIQLAWTMVAGSKYAYDAPAFVAAAKARTDLTAEQRDAFDEIASTSIVRTAEAAMRAHDPARAVAVLNDAAHDLPGNARIRSALASVYLQQREFDRALDLYRSTGMSGATAADYRAAAGIAQQAQRNIVAEKFLWEGPSALAQRSRAASHDGAVGAVARRLRRDGALPRGGSGRGSPCRIERRSAVVRQCRIESEAEAIGGGPRRARRRRRNVVPAG